MAESVYSQQSNRNPGNNDLGDMVDDKEDQSMDVENDAMSVITQSVFHKNDNHVSSVHKMTRRSLQNASIGISQMKVIPLVIYTIFVTNNAKY